MEILSAEEMAARLDYMSPLHPKEEPRDSLWCIPFEWGCAAKGTKITVAKAREIASELRALVAEHDMRELKRYFDKEQARVKELERRLVEEGDLKFALQQEILVLKGNLREAKRRKK
jgi:hypothetical protein